MAWRHVIGAAWMAARSGLVEAAPLVVIVAAAVVAVVAAAVAVVVAIIFVGHGDCDARSWGARGRSSHGHVVVVVVPALVMPRWP